MAAPANEPSSGAIVRSTRRELSWVEDEKLRELEYREESTALGLGVITGGGGYLYTGDTKKGLIGLAAMLGALVMAPIIPGSLGLLPLAAVMGWGAVGAWRQSKLINRFLRNSRGAVTDNSGFAASQQLLASMPKRAPEQAALPAGAAPPQATGTHTELIARLQKLATIRSSGVMDDNEHRARKIDILSEVAAGLDAAETESLLFALLPLLDAQVLSEEDIAFVKELGS